MTTMKELFDRMDEVEEKEGTRAREWILVDEIVKLTRRVEKLEPHGGNMIGGKGEI